jgi:hypothetical protein
MIPRKPLTINNGAALKRTKMFRQSGALQSPRNQKQETSIFVHARTGRPNSEGFGGGKVVGKRLS